MTAYTKLNLFEYADNNSHKLWVIGLDDAGMCVTWYGRATWHFSHGNTVCRLSQGGQRVSGDFDVLVHNKRKKGYQPLERAVFDPSATTVTLGQSVGNGMPDMPVIPSMMAIDCHAPHDVVLSACIAIADRLSAQLPQYVSGFHRLAVVKTIVEARATPSSCDYEQGPLALCFLVAMKRYLNDHAHTFALFLDDGCEVGDTFSEWSQITRHMPIPEGFDLRSVAEAMGAIDAPINFGAWNATVPAAFI